MRQRRRGIAAVEAGAAAECDSRGIGLGDHTARHHIGAIADPRGRVADRGGRYAEFRKEVEPGNPGIVAPDPGIVKDCRRNTELGRDIGRIDATMRAIDDDRTFGFGADPGDAVGGQDRRGLGGHGIVSRKEAAAAIMPGATKYAQAANPIRRRQLLPIKMTRAFRTAR